MTYIQLELTKEEDKELGYIKLDLGLRRKSEAIQHLIQQSIGRRKGK